MRMRLVLALCAVFALTVGVAAATADQGGNSANAKLCQKGGWQSLVDANGGTFANEEACVSYGAQGGTISASPFAVSQSTCISLGGTFSTDPSTSFEPVADVLWTCNNGPSQNFEGSLGQDCNTDISALRAGGGDFIGGFIVSGSAPWDFTCWALGI
jgi:hypothetical protein